MFLRYDVGQKVRVCMKTCDTCKFWKPAEDRDTDHNACLCPAIRFVKSEGAARDSGSIHDDHAIVVDGSGYFGAFCPEPKFGCIHHEVK